MKSRSDNIMKMADAAAVVEAGFTGVKTICSIRIALSKWRPILVREALNHWRAVARDESEAVSDVFMASSPSKLLIEIFICPLARRITIKMLWLCEMTSSSR